MRTVLAPIARMASDCAHVMKAPAGSKLALLHGLLPLGRRKMGFSIQHPQPGAAAFLYREIFARQQYFFETDNPSPVVFDCGANVGVATMYFRWLYPHSRIQAFEADARTVDVLRVNLRANHLTDVAVHHCALWDEDGEIDFYTDPGEPSMLHMSTSAARANVQCTAVPARRLSEFITEPIDFLKLDVEGAEQRVLQDLVISGKISLVSQMVIEYHHRLGASKSCLAAFLKSLEECGFEYQINALMDPVLRREAFQDVLLGCYRPTNSRSPIYRAADGESA